MRDACGAAILGAQKCHSFKGPDPSFIGAFYDVYNARVRILEAIYSGRRSELVARAKVADVGSSHLHGEPLGFTLYMIADDKLVVETSPLNGP